MSKFKFPHCPTCNEQVIPDFRRCPACGGSLVGLKSSSDAERSFDPLSHSRWQKISMGRDPRGRLVGTAVAGMFCTFLLSSWLLYLNTPDPTNTLVFLVSVAGLFSAYDVWAFTHGKRTSITHYGRHEATPSNTFARVLGLLLDVVMMAACVWVFLSKT